MALKIINKPTFKFAKNADLYQAILDCKEFAKEHDCVVLLQYQEHTKPVDNDTNAVLMEKTFHNKIFNKHSFIHDND